MCRKNHKRKSLTGTKRQILQGGIHMNMKKLTAALTALTCCAGMLGTLPGLEFGSVQTYAAEAVYNDFEVNYDGWHGSTQTVQLTAENGAGFGGTRGMTAVFATSITSPQLGHSTSTLFPVTSIIAGMLCCP